jgi:hypothetical protein
MRRNADKVMQQQRDMLQQRDQATQSVTDLQVLIERY